MAKSHLLTGSDRIEYWEPIRRLIRKGNLSDLDRSDYDRVLAVMNSGNMSSFENYISVLNPQYLGMSTTLLEWCLAFPAALEKKVSPSGVKSVTEKALRVWSGVIEKNTKAGKSVLQAVRNYGPDEASRKKASEEVNRIPAGTIKKSLAAAGNSDWNLAKKYFNQYVNETRTRHDFLCQYLWIYPSVIEKEFGQPVSEEVMLRSFETCSFYAPIFDLLSKLEPEGVVSILSEHLRAHFSGPGRKGAVKIVEEEDCFRLIFDACGSGGAMRRKAVENPCSGLGNYPQASAATWGLAGEVPSYCAHCAQNEIVMTRRTGYPVWVTEFDPDPSRPCGWTVYKDPANIPEKYFRRIGFKKDPSNFKNPEGIDAIPFQKFKNHLVKPK